MITLMSHGFKFSRPEANYVFDVSFFKNPWRDEDIRNETEDSIRRHKIRKYMLSQIGFEGFVDSVSAMLIRLDATFPRENIRVAFCCSAGEYRSPSVVMIVSERLDEFKVKHKIIRSKDSKL